jgi:hypothetical protein
VQSDLFGAIHDLLLKTSRHVKELGIDLDEQSEELSSEVTQDTGEDVRKIFRLGVEYASLTEGERSQIEDQLIEYYLQTGNVLDGTVSLSTQETSQG